MICTFFGHRDCPFQIESNLKHEIINLIESCSVDTFYVGNNGNFDKIAYKTLLSLNGSYKIKIYVVLAYLPNSHVIIQNSIYPEGLEKVPPKFAIPWRNKWMVNNSDYIIAFLRHDFGGAAKAVIYAEKKGVKVIRI